MTAYYKRLIYFLNDFHLAHEVEFKKKTLDWMCCHCTTAHQLFFQVPPITVASTSNASLLARRLVSRFLRFLSLNK